MSIRLGELRWSNGPFRAICRAVRPLGRSRAARDIIGGLPVDADSRLRPLNDLRRLVTKAVDHFVCGLGRINEPSRLFSARHRKHGRVDQPDLR
jgi:hypothetical protein